jgi:hypothetical protein
VGQVGKTLGLLGGATAGAVALGLYAYFGVMKGDEQAQRSKEAAQQVFPTAAAQGPSAPSGFRALTVVAAGQTTKLAHTASGWRITSPVDAKADSAAVDALVSALLHDRYKQTVDAHPTQADLARYGLDAPRFRVTAEFQRASGKKETLDLAGGIDNPFDGSVYVKREGEDAVHAIAGTFQVAVAKSTFELREKRLVPFEETRLKEIDLASGRQRIALRLDDAGHWQLSAPTEERADDAAARALWTAIQTERATAFPEDTPQARQDFGLEHPVLEATFVPEHGAPTRIALGERGSGEARHAFAAVTTGGHHALAQVPPALIDALRKTPDDLRDHTVLSFQPEQVAEIAVKPADRTPFTLTRKRNADGSRSDWSLAGEKSPRLAGAKVSALLWTLQSLKATGFGPVHPSDRTWQAHGLDDKAATVTLKGEGGRLLAALVVGKPVKGKPDQLWAKGSRDQVLELERASLSDLPWSVDALALPPDAAAQADVAR